VQPGGGGNEDRNFLYHLIKPNLTNSILLSAFHVHYAPSITKVVPDHARLFFFNVPKDKKARINGKTGNLAQYIYKS
jgi:hypothetical protein